MSSVLFLACALGVQTLQARTVSDSGITMAVERELLHDPGVEAHRVDVSTEQGVVTLSGVVNNILAKERAARVAETVKGVRLVVNEITVQPAPLTDQTIRESVNTALTMDPATESYKVEVVVDDGRVILSGKAASSQEKELAATVAKGVAGVTDLVNTIEVKPRGVRTDAEIKAEIEQSLKWNALVDHEFITVHVRDRKVSLEGTVDSAAEKDQAVSEAWTSGVAAVDAEALLVEVHEEISPPDQRPDVSDLAVGRAVKRRMLSHPRLEDFEIEVTVTDGVVFLSGAVDNLKAKRTAAEVAENTTGVLRVRNMIRVRPDDMPSDAAIHVDVEAALLREPYVEADQVSVAVDNGRLTLSGTVDTAFERAQAEDAAARVKGVIAIENNLLVDDAEAYYRDPYVDEDWRFEAAPSRSQPAVSGKSDWEIAEDIREELWWSPYVDSTQVEVDVDNGLAILSGTVDTMEEWAAARSNAYEGGATAVANNLKVRHGPERLQP
jgi:osmotically-inducible protein OsmY